MKKFTFNDQKHGEDEYNRLTLKSCLDFIMVLDSSKLDISDNEYQQLVEAASRDDLERR